MERRVAKEWEQYRKNVLPANANAVQVQECRRAFYAGIAAYYFGLMRWLSPGAEETDEDMAMMAEVEAELREFTDQVKAGEN